MYWANVAYIAQYAYTESKNIMVLAIDIPNTGYVIITDHLQNEIHLWSLYYFICMILLYPLHHLCPCTFICSLYLAVHKSALFTRL